MAAGTRRFPPRIGIVGWGDIARYHERHLRSAGASVVGVVTRHAPPGGVRAYASLAAMLPDVDAVSIAVPNHLHASLCVEALEAGRAVFVEKPLCMTPDELSRVQAAMRASAAPVTVGFRLRHNPALLALRASVAQPRVVRCVYRLGLERLAEGKPWTHRVSESGGAFMTLGVHALDTARWLADARGRPLEGLEARAERHGGVEYPMLVSMCGTLAGGTRVEAVADLRGHSPFRLTVDIDGATVDAERLPRPRPEDPGAPDVEYASMMAGFVAAIDARAQPEAERADLLQCHRELMAARELAGDGS